MRVMRGTNSKYKKTCPKKHIFGTERECIKSEKTMLPKNTYMAHMTNFNLLVQLGEELGEDELLFMVKKGEILHISSTN